MMQRKPLIVTFLQLAYALRALHRWRKADLDRLHDVWLKGAPTPNSRVLTKTHDPRVAQRGNYEARIVIPKLLEAWVTDVATRNGLQVKPGEAYTLVRTVGAIFARDLRGLIQRR